MWDQIWQFAIGHYIFHTLIIVAVAVIIFHPERAQRFFGRYKKIKAGPNGIELEAKDESGNTGIKDIEQDKEIESILGKLKNIESLIEKDAIERKKRQEEVDYRLDKQYEFIREAALKSCVANIWGDKVPLIEFLDAALLSKHLVLTAIQ
jgi:hypothetical protein